MKVIAFAGYATSGKTTACRLISSFISNNCSINSFASDIKKTANKILKFTTGRDIDVLKVCPEEKEKIRPLLVWIGEYMRSIDEDYWVNEMKHEALNKYKSDELFLIDDLRYKNEAEWVIDDGGTVIYIDAGIEPPNEEEKKSLAEVRELKKTYGGKQYFEIKNDKKSIDKLLSQIKGII